MFKDSHESFHFYQYYVLFCRLIVLFSDYLCFFLASVYKHTRIEQNIPSGLKCNCSLIHSLIGQLMLLPRISNLFTTSINSCNIVCEPFCLLYFSCLLKRLMIWLFHRRKMHHFFSCPAWRRERDQLKTGETDRLDMTYPI